MNEFLENQKDYTKIMTPLRKKLDKSSGAISAFRGGLLLDSTTFSLKGNETKDHHVSDNYQFSLELESTEDLNTKLRSAIKRYDEHSAKYENWANRWENLIDILEDNDLLLEEFKNFVALAKLNGYNI